MTDETIDTEEVVSEDSMGYEEVLRYSQNIRRTIVSSYMEQGVPKDVKETGMVLKALADMDKSALEERKNAIDSGNADSSRKVAEAMQEFIRLQKNRNPFQRDSDDQPVGAVPELTLEQLGDFELAPGETDIETIQETADDFLERMEATFHDDDVEEP